MKQNNKLILISVGVIAFVVAALVSFIAIYFIASSQSNAPETFLTRSESPDQTYVLEAYVTEPGATVDFSVKVYLVTDGQKSLIYDAYHEQQATIDWTDDCNVVINGHALDLSAGETYDWRKG